ncbi:hypothetical protein BO71DRAFT_433557 [Aspergillus ellipticus CBS 707.79]|uniref:Uncharacterized protein n=1 Tax=Aspergillus ellipticus CBS 707.79 TaxID=1448320 RepID=A0A319D0I4_9EURO|nr:hypothetical protein BO71DRAFT_433557 [Aspergillus ellipticus CBS 707.79]
MGGFGVSQRPVLDLGSFTLVDRQGFFNFVGHGCTAQPREDTVPAANIPARKAQDYAETPQMPNTEANTKQAEIPESKAEVEWLQSDVVKPFWIELWDECIKHTSRTKRGLGLAAVQEQMIRGEARGLAKYTRRNPQKHDWEIRDYLVMFMLQVKSANLNQSDGMFYQRGFTENQMDNMVWALKNIISSLHAPIQIQKKSGGTVIFGTKSDGKRKREEKEYQTRKRTALEKSNSQPEPQPNTEKTGNGETDIDESLEEEELAQLDSDLAGDESQPWMDELISERKRIIFK